VPLVVAVLLETAVLALVGALLGSGVAWVLFNDRHVTQIRDTFDLAISPQLFALAIAWALVLAILGGLPPAVRGARLSVADAFR
jgi:putative ABC transport system permease protein